MTKKNLIITSAIIFILVGFVIFIFNSIVIPKERLKTENKIRQEIDDRAMAKKTVAVLLADENVDNTIPKYTVLNDEIISKKIKLVEMPEKYCIKNPITDINHLLNRVTVEDLRPGEQIAIDSLSVEKKWFSDYNRLKEYNVRTIVAGEVKAGNLVDIVVTYENGDYDVVIPKIKVRKLINPRVTAANEQKTEGTQQAPVNQDIPSTDNDGFILVIAPENEEQYRDMELARKLGKFETRKYLDESQPASVKTFDYNTAIKKAGLQLVSNKVFESMQQNKQNQQSQTQQNQQLQVKTNEEKLNLVD